jgi:hypothetical protein
LDTIKKLSHSPHLEQAVEKPNKTVYRARNRMCTFPLSVYKLKTILEGKNINLKTHFDNLANLQIRQKSILGKIKSFVLNFILEEIIHGLNWA